MITTQNNTLQEEEHVMDGHELLNALNWRYAAKRMNGNKIPQETLDRILEAIRLSASSYGLQPYTIIIIENKDTLAKLKQAANEQAVITEASHLLVFAAWENLIQQKIDDYISQVAQERNVSEESLQHTKSKIESQMAFTDKKNAEWAARQAYIALGTGLIAAAAEHVDATPMEGFNPTAMDALLGLKDRGLHSVVLLALGYRNAERDPRVNAKKVRRKKEKLYIKM